MKTGMIVGATVVGLLVGTIGSAQAARRPSPDQLAARYRQALMTVIVVNDVPLAAMGRGRAPYNAASVRKYSARLGALAEMVPDAFERNTSHARGIRTLALPKIWQQKASFLDHADKLKLAVDHLETAIAKGDSESTIKTAINNVGRSCGSCHKAFRRKLSRR